MITGDNMLDKFIYEGLHFIMKWSGEINSWAWRKHVKILRKKKHTVKTFKEWLKEVEERNGF